MINWNKVKTALPRLPYLAGSTAPYKSRPITAKMSILKYMIACGQLQVKQYNHCKINCKCSPRVTKHRNLHRTRDIVITIAPIAGIDSNSVSTMTLRFFRNLRMCTSHKNTTSNIQQHMNHMQLLSDSVLAKFLWKIPHHLEPVLLYSSYKAQLLTRSSTTQSYWQTW